MRSVRDKNLPEPFRLWIDRTYTLPANVRVLPRIISPITELTLFMIGLASCGVMGTVLFSFVPYAKISTEGWSVIAVIAAALFGYLYWVGRRLWVSIVAYRDRKAGVLRLGILIGPEGLLVRINPNRCYPVVMAKFVKADTWSGGGDSGSDYLRIVTKDGDIDIWDHDIAADANEVNEVAYNVTAGVAAPVTSQKTNKPKKPGSKSSST